MNITVESNLKIPSDDNIEIVERKGVGHPDTLADGLAEKVSILYSKYCLNEFGIVLHHNTDKTSIMGGLINVDDWGEATFVKPIRVLINGRFSKSFNGKKIPLKRIFKEAVTQQLNMVLPHLVVDKDVVIIDETTDYAKRTVWFKPKSIEDLPEYPEPHTNDTSTVIGYWPLTPAERLVIDLEGYFYKGDRIPRFNFIGHDIKVMIVRRYDHYDITMCVPFIIKNTPNYSFFKEKLGFITKELRQLAISVLPKGSRISVHINNEEKNKHIESIQGRYCAVSGSAIDWGEEGVVGRGNNKRGIIPSMRPYTMEAAWGKNPAYMVGKVMGLVVEDLAKKISIEFDCNTQVIITTRIGDKLFDPHNISVNTSKKVPVAKIKTIIQETLKLRNWTQRIIDEEVLIPRTNYYF